MRDEEHVSVVDVIWEDTRSSPDFPIDPSTLASPNLYYDVFHARWVGRRHGGSWSANRRVSDVSSLQEQTAAGRRTDLSANERLLFAAWTDRREATSVPEADQDVYGSAIKGPFESESHH